MLRNLRKEFSTAIAAGEVAIRIDTDEISDALATMKSVAVKLGWELQVFDVLVGTQWHSGMPPERETTPRGTFNASSPANILNAIGGDQQPKTVLHVLNEFWKQPVQIETGSMGETRPVILVIKNLHLAFDGRREAMAAMIQHIVDDKVGDINHTPEQKEALKNHGIDKGDAVGKHIVGLMPPNAKIPDEVAPLFRRLVHELPDTAELNEILMGVAPPTNDDNADDADNVAGLTPEDRQRVCKFALGLTRLQAEGVFGACIAQYGRIVPSYVWEQKSAILNSEGLVTLHAGKERFADISGMRGAKNALLQLLAPNKYDDNDPDVRAKGVLFVGPPGTGKSLVAKATGNELGLPTLMIDPGKWMGSYVGESEAKTRRGFEILRAHAPCIAVVDEAEKVIPKSRGGGGDSGVSSRMEGSFLTNMNDLTEQIFWVFTANDVANMHEAFFRAERIDMIFYVGLPSQEIRAAIWKQYGKKFFPEEVKLANEMVPFPGHRYVKFDDALAALRKAKKPKTEHWAGLFTLPLMCVTPDVRVTYRETLREEYPEIEGAIELVDDTDWSPAEIRACCRLSRKLNEVLTVTAQRIRPVSATAPKVIERLEEWATEAALDVETGTLYRPKRDEGAKTTDGRVIDHDEKRKRRKVKRHDDTY